MSEKIAYSHPSLTPALLLEERNHLATMSRSKTELIEAVQRKALEEIIFLASEKSSWWRGRLKLAVSAITAGSDIHEIVRQLPVTTRRDMQDNFSRMGIDVPGSSRQDYSTGSTSGSTGQMVRVYKYLPDVHRILSASVLIEAYFQKRKDNFDTLSLSLLDDEYELKPMGRPLSLINWRGLGAKLSGAKRSPDEILDELEKHKFGYLFANANLVRLLARAQLQNPRKIKLREIISWVDLVDSELRDLIKQAFGCRIIDRYSAEELGPIAVQCPKYDHLHLISPYLYMEIVDENGDAVPAGQMGRIQLTSLWIRSMPLFRYQLGDLVVAGPPCKKVNWPTIEKVAGRVRDYITGPGGELRMARLPSTSIRNSPNFLDSRIYLFQDKAVLLAATARPSTQQEIAKFHEELVYAFYLEPGMSEVLFSNSGKWREIWKRRVFEQIDEPYSKKRIMELANLEDQEPG